MHTCDHLHLVLLQILENRFVGFHPVQKLLQHFHIYSNINTLICTVPLLSHHVGLKHVTCESTEQCAVILYKTKHFLCPWRLQPSNIAHGSASVCKNHGCKLFSFDLYPTCLSQNSSKQGNALEQYHISLGHCISNTVQHHTTSYIPIAIVGSWPYSQY